MIKGNVKVRSGKRGSGIDNYLKLGQLAPKIDFKMPLDLEF